MEHFPVTAEDAHFLLLLIILSIFERKIAITSLLSIGY
jgi:hypothetical protein